MTNNSKLKILVAVFFCFILILVGMIIYALHEKLNKTVDTSAGAVTTQASVSTAAASSKQSASGSTTVIETMDLKLYFYDADNYDKPKEIRTVTIDKKLYQDDITAAINKVFIGTDLKINKAAINGDTAVIDLPKEVSAKFNEGSAGGITRTNILAMTILNLPGIQKMQVTVDGTAGVAEDHYNFDGTFIKTENGYEFK